MSLNSVLKVENIMVVSVCPRDGRADGELQLTALPGIMRLVSHIASPTKDQNLKFGIQFLLNAYHSSIILKSRNCKSNRRKSGTVCSFIGEKTLFCRPRS